MHSFCKSTSKVTQKNHVLAGIEGKDLGPKFFLGIDLGVLEGQISGGLFSDSIFDPSVIGATNHHPSSGQPAVQAVDTAMGSVAATLELQPGSHHLLLHCHAARGQLVVANSGRQGGLALYKTN